LQPAKFERRAALRIQPGQDGGALPLYSFNIASVGLDAFVADMTNRLKRILPGDSYRFWVDVATLFYDRVYDVIDMELTAWKDSAVVLETHMHGFL